MDQVAAAGGGCATARGIVTTDDLIVDLDWERVEVASQRVLLSPKEYQMLELLAEKKGTAVTKQMFLAHLYKGVDEPEPKIIDVFICHLRKKLAYASKSTRYPAGKDYIETVWAKGYMLREPS